MSFEPKKIEPGKPFKNVIHWPEDTKFVLESISTLYPLNVEVEKNEEGLMVVPMNALLSSVISVQGKIVRDGMEMPWSVDFVAKDVERKG